MFIDRAKIHVVGGRGGNGSLSFRREKYVEMGGPDGGNGGKGGDVWVVADPQKTTLYDFTYRPVFKGESGVHGRGKKQTGACGEDLMVNVPPGTMIFHAGRLLADLKKPGDRYLAARGGHGGRGNASFKTSANTAPRISERGEPPEDVELNLELKLVADVGLLGFPNAGKSTFLSVSTQAKPKIADYPFTTLSPNLGVALVGGKTFVIADIPGIIEGAHEGKGLGDKFLRHVERTRLLVHLVDVFGFDKRTALKNFRTLNKELASHSKTLAEKPQIVVATKMDLTGSDKALASFRKGLGKTKVFPLSSATGRGHKELMAHMAKVLAHLPEPAPFEPEPADVVIEPDFAIETVDPGVWRVGGKKIDRLVAITNFDQDEALSRFQNILKKMGVDDSLSRSGAHAGDRVQVGTHEFKYRPDMHRR